MDMQSISPSTKLTFFREDGKFLTLCECLCDTSTHTNCILLVPFYDAHPIWPMASPLWLPQHEGGMLGMALSHLPWLATRSLNA